MQRAAFWLICLASVALRFWNIDGPFEDRWSWRQSDVAAIARNYYEKGFQFSRPQIDWSGDQPGFVGTEFPLLPFTAALLYQITGVREWVGRLLTIAFFATSLPFVFLIVRRAAGEMAAMIALIFYSFAPLMVATSRAFMPDVPSLSCALGGLYLFCRWLDLADERSLTSDWYLLLASALLALALLLKPTTGTIGAALLALSWQKFGNRIFFEPRLWIFAAIALTPSVIWYLHADDMARQFYPHHMFGAGGIRIMNFSWYWHILVQTFTISLTPVLFVLALLGLFFSRARFAFRWWLCAMILFIIVIGYGNRHEWYRLPLVPIAATFAGMALRTIARNRIGRTCAVAILILFLTWSGVSAQRYLAPSARPLYELGCELRVHTPPDALIVAADDGDPTLLYYAHRKGWHFLERDGIYGGNPTGGSQLIADLESLRGRGATHLIFYRGTKWWLEYYPEFAEYLAHTATLVGAPADSRIYELRRK